MLARTRGVVWVDWWERHQTYAAMVLGAFVLGSFVGALALNALVPAERLGLLELVKGFLTTVIARQVASPTVFGTALVQNLKVLGLIYILGVSVAGFLLVLLAVFFRGFVLGFSVGFFLSSLHGIGLAVALIAVVIPNLALVPAWLAAGAGGLAFSWQLISRSTRLSSQRLPQLFVQYTAVVAIGVGLVALGSVLQGFMAPTLLHWMGPWGI